MPSITTQIIGPAAAAFTSNQASSPVQRQGTTPHISPEQIAAASQIRAKEETTKLDQKSDRVNIQIPKRVEPTYGPHIKKKMAQPHGEEHEKSANPEQQSLDKLA